MDFAPEYKHSYFGSKLELDHKNRKILLKQAFSGRRAVLDYDQIDNIVMDLEGKLRIIRFTVKDLKKPHYIIHFYRKNKCEEWFSRLVVALDLE